MKKFKEKLRLWPLFCSEEGFKWQQTRGISEAEHVIPAARTFYVRYFQGLTSYRRNHPRAGWNVMSSNVAYEFEWHVTNGRVLS